MRPAYRSRRSLARSAFQFGFHGIFHCKMHGANDIVFGTVLFKVAAAQMRGLGRIPYGGIFLTGMAVQIGPAEISGAIFRVQFYRPVKILQGTLFILRSAPLNNDF